MLERLPLEVLGKALENLPLADRMHAVATCGALWRNKQCLPCVFLRSCNVIHYSMLQQAPPSDLYVHQSGQVRDSGGVVTVDAIGMSAPALLTLICAMVQRANIPPESKSLSMLHCMSQPALRATALRRKRLQVMATDVQRQSWWQELPAKQRTVLECDILPRVTGVTRSSVSEILRCRLMQQMRSPAANAPQTLEIVQLLSHAALVVGCAEPGLL